MKRVHCMVSGRVQGVGYRAFVVARARALGLSGGVRNLPDGRVEAWAEGDAAAVHGFVAELERGPVHAIVERVVSDWEAPRGVRGFHVER